MNYFKRNYFNLRGKMNIKTTDYDVVDFSTNDKLLFIPYDTNSDFNGLSKVSYTASSLPIYKLFKKEN